MGTDLDGMRRWGYITIDGVGRVARGERRPIGKPGSGLALTRRGRAAAEVWRSLPGEIEQRWRERFTDDAIDRLRGALRTIERQADVPLPEFMPICSAIDRGLGESEPNDDLDGATDDDAELSLVSLVARVLLLFTRSYERGAQLSLAIQLNGVRVIDREGVALRELPRISGVSEAACAMIVKRLETSGCCEQLPLERGRGKQVRLIADRGLGPNGEGRSGCSARSAAGKSATARTRSRSCGARLSRSSATAPELGRRCSRGCIRRPTAGERRSPNPSGCPGFRWCCTVAATPTAVSHDRD
jgi:hypothetical protein